MSIVGQRAALKGLTTTRAAVAQLAVPVLAAIGGVLFLAGAITHRSILSSVIILGGIDLADRPPTALADGEQLELGSHSMRWFDTPHLPCAWECGFLIEEETGTLLCGDLLGKR